MAPTETDYKSVSAFTSALGFDAHSIDITTGSDPFFTDPANGDYSIRSSSPAYHAGEAIPASVAAATGLSTAAGQSMGAYLYP